MGGGCGGGVINDGRGVCVGGGGRLWGRGYK